MTTPTLAPSTLEEIRAARARIAATVLRTPLVRLSVDAPAEIWLKLENLQPIGSFKLRGAVSAIRQAPPEAVARGVVTPSAGNMAQGVAWAARELGVPATVVAPDSAPRAKLDAVARLGGEAVLVPFEKLSVLNAGKGEATTEDGPFVPTSLPNK